MLESAAISVNSLEKSFNTLKVLNKITFRVYLPETVL